MTTPLTVFSEAMCGCVLGGKKHESKVCYTTSFLDLAAVITLVTLSILGTKGIVTMSPAALFGCRMAASVISGLWAIMIVGVLTCVVKK